MLTLIAAARDDDAVQTLLRSGDAQARGAQVLADLPVSTRVFLFAVAGCIALLSVGCAAMLYRRAQTRRTPQLPGGSAVPIPDSPSRGRVPGFDQSSAAYREEEAR